MLIDGHLLVGTSLMSFTDLQARARPLRPGHRPVPAAADAQPDRARRQRPARLVPHDVGAHALDAGPVRSRGRARRCRARARGGARPPVHHRLRPVPRGPAAAVAARAGAGALALATGLLDLADEHEFRIWTAAGTVLRGAARVELGRSEEGLADVRNGIGLYGELRSPPIFWPFLLFVQARACASGGQSGRGPAGARSVDRDPRHGLRRVPPARALDREGRPASGPLAADGGGERPRPSRGTGRRSTARPSSAR